MRWLKVVLALLLLPLGALLVHFGDVDDSPGLGGIGLIIGATGLYLVYRQWRKGRPQPRA